MKLPIEFADVLTPTAAKWLRKRGTKFSSEEGGYKKIDNAIRLEYCAEIMRLLETRMKPYLNPVNYATPTDPKSMHWHKKIGMPPLSWRSSTLFCNYDDPAGTYEGSPELSCPQDGYDTFEGTGIPQLFRSDSWHEWMLNVLGEDESSFLPANNNIQTSRYVSGDNIGLHNDYYGTKVRPAWFIDAHISFVNQWVKQQFMLFGHSSIDQVTDVAKMGSVGLYKLPMWHAVTPLVAKRGHEEEAYRWLLILDRYYR